MVILPGVCGFLPHRTERQCKCERVLVDNTLNKQGESKRGVHCSNLFGLARYWFLRLLQSPFPGGSGDLLFHHRKPQLSKHIFCAELGPVESLDAGGDLGESESECIGAIDDEFGGFASHAQLLIVQHFQNAQPGVGGRSRHDGSSRHIFRDHLELGPLHNTNTTSPPQVRHQR